MTTTIEDLIARALHAADCGCSDGEPHDEPYATQADALLPLVRKAQAEALREAADEVDGDGMISRHDLEEYWQGWDDSIRSGVETLRNRADRIEQNSEGNVT